MDDVGAYLPELWEDAVVESSIGVGLEHVVVQLLIGQFVGLFELAVLRHVLLDCVVGEVH